jgi:hypothetical protein
MTMPLGWKNNSTRMTLAEYLTSRKDQSEKNFDSLEIELKLALAALSSYQEAEQLDGGGPPPYTPTGYNFVTGEQMIEIQVKERQETMRKARLAAYDADDEYKRNSDSAKKITIRGNFALAYILFWKLYRIAPWIYDLPLCMEQCLMKLWLTQYKGILESATSCVYHMPQNPEYLQTISMLHKILLEFSQTTWVIE